MKNLNDSQEVSTTFQPSLRGRLLQCAAASAAAWVLLPTTAHAAVPPECDEQNAPNIITCVVPEPDEVGPIEVNQDNTTIVIGDADTPTTVRTELGRAIELSGNGAQTVVVNRDSLVTTGGQAAIRIDGIGTLSVVTREGSFVSSTQNPIIGYAIFADGVGDIQIAAEGGLLGASSGIGAFNSGAGSIAITATDQTTGLNNFGIWASNSNNGTDIEINTVGGSVTGGGGGIRAENEGSGSLLISTSDVQSLQADSTAIFAENSGTDLLIDTTQGSVEGHLGIEAINQGSGSLDIFTGDVFASGADGILTATGFDSTTTEIDTTAGVVEATGHGIFASHAGTGVIRVTTASVSSENEAGVRLFLANTDGAILDTTAGTVQAGGSGVLVAQFGTGLIDIDTADVIAGSIGISVMSETQANVNTTQGLVTAGDVGIVVAADGDGGATIRTADVTSENDAAIRVFGTAGDILILTEEGSLSAATEGVNVSQDGPGGVAIRAADITADTGILVESLGDGVLIDSSSGAIDASTTGIVAGLGGTGSLLIRTGDVTGLSEDGIVASTTQTTNQAFVRTVDGSILARQTGINLSHSGTGQASVTTGDVVGETGNGVSVTSSSANVKVDTSAGDVRGGTNGVAAQMLNSGSIEVVTGDVESAVGNGIIAGGFGSDVAIDSRAGRVNAGAVGIAIINNGTGAASILTGDVASTGNTAVTLENAGTSSLIDTSAGDVTGATNGIIAVHGGSEGVNVSTGNVTAQSGVGVTVAGGADGNGVSIDTSAGSVAATALGIAAINSGAGDLDVRTGDVSSSEGTAIELTNLASSNQLLLDTTAGSVSGEVNGIFVEHQGSLGAVINAGDVSGAEGAILVSNQGSDDLSITTGNLTSVNGSGLVAANSNASFDMMIDTSAGSINAGATGITAVSLSSGSIEITSGDVTAQQDGILFQTSGGDAFITNEGTIEAGGVEIAASDASVGAITIVNNGRIVGNISLGSDIDSVTNNGEFFATDNSVFGEGSDSFANNGVLAASGTVAFTGLEQLTNGGRISLANGSFGDTLQLAGDYLGSGGTLELDVNLSGADPTDTLVIDGAATGETAIALSLDGQQLGFGNSTLLVDAGAGTSATAFALQGGEMVSHGLLTFSLNFDAANNDFLLGSAVGPAVFRTLKIGEGAQSVWYRSADAVDAHIDSTRHGDNEARKPVWGQIYGSSSDRDDRFGFTSGGFTHDIVLDYSQDYFGFQLGAEGGRGLEGEGAFYGATAGYLSSDLSFDGLADGVRYDAFNLGVYAGYRSGGFFAHGLAKYDFIDADIDGQSAGYNAEVDGNSIGFRAEAGYRWDSGSFFIEPSASLEYQSIDLNNFSALGANFELGTVDGLRGIAGARLGGESELENGSTLTYYASFSAVHEFEGDGEITFSTPLNAATFVNNPIDTFARIDLGLNIATKGGVTGFVEGNADLSGDYSGFGGRAGLRIKF